MRSRLVQALVAEIYIVGLIGFFALCGFYSIPPSEAVPDGVTRIVMRAPGEPFFNSPLSACRDGAPGDLLECFAERLERSSGRALLDVPFLPWAHRAAIQ